MIIYRVSVQINEFEAIEWCQWMANQHIPDVLNTGYFVDHSFMEILEPAPSDGIKSYCIEYVSPDMKTLRAYQETEAPRLKAEHSDRYQGKVSATRTLLKTVAMALLSLAFAAPTGLNAASVVPPEICLEGEPVQLLNYRELPLESTLGLELSTRAGLVQETGRLTILGSFVLGSAFTLTGLTMATLGSYRGQERIAQGGLAFAGLGLGIGIGGVFGGQRLLSQAKETADFALMREQEQTGRDIRWRSKDEPCADDYFE